MSLLLPIAPLACLAAPASALRPQPGEPWRGFIFAPNNGPGLDGFEPLVTDVLVPSGVNIVIFDMHWRNFRYTCHPRLADIDFPEGRGMTGDDSACLADVARRHGLRVMVRMNLLTTRTTGRSGRRSPSSQSPAATTPGARCTPG